MNRGVRKIVLPIALAAVAFSVSGCRKKKPAVPAPQAEAPTIEAPQPAPPPTETTTPTPPADATTATTTAPAPAPKPKKSRRVAKKPSAGVPAANNTSTPPATVANNTGTPAPPPPATITTPSGKVIVPEGSTGEPTGQISTTMPVSKENETKLNTERSLQTTEKDLKAITWAPSADQRNMMEQIKTYISQSRSANTEGDVLRASNLAQKARLLCDELLKK
jgi:hypothetical protein